MLDQPAEGDGPSLTAKPRQAEKSAARSRKSPDTTDEKGVVSRVVSVMWALSEHETFMPLGQIADLCGLSASTAHRLLKQLADLGMIARGPQRRYCLGPEFHYMASLIEARSQFVQASMPYMREAVRQLGHTCFVSLYLPTKQSRSAIAKIDPVEPPRVAATVRESRSLLWGSSGRSILAYLPSDTIAQILDKAQPSPGSGRRPPTLQSLMRSLREIQARGYAISHGELEHDVVGMAVPIFGPDHKIVGNLAIAERKSRWNKDSERLVSTVLMQQAAMIALHLGQPARPAFPFTATTG